MNKYFLILLTACVLPVAQCRADAPNEQSVTVLFNEAATEIKAALVEGDQLWVAVDQVHHVNGFDPKPEGFCSADLCIPIPKSNDWQTKKRPHVEAWGRGNRIIGYVFSSGNTLARWLLNQLR